MLCILGKMGVLDALIPLEIRARVIEDYRILM